MRGVLLLALVAFALLKKRKPKKLPSDKKLPSERSISGLEKGVLL